MRLKKRDLRRRSEGIILACKLMRRLPRRRLSGKKAYQEGNNRL
jgi:hypothetical protein